MNTRIIAVLYCCAVSVISAAPQYYLTETPTNVLFVGNSYTYTNLSLHLSVPAMALKAAVPDTIGSGASLIGGAPLSRHWNEGNAPAMIRTGDYDHVVLQEFVSMVPGSAELDSFFHYAALFDALIDSVGAQTVFYLTWQTPYMQYAYLKAGYDSAAVLFDAFIVPCGMGFELVNAERPSINLYGPDNHHPGKPGTFLNTCVFYSAFTRKSPVDIDYTPFGTDISDEDYAYLQGAAWDVMRDFLEPPCTDSTAPTVPAGLAGEGISTSSNLLSWTAASHTGCGIGKYLVYRGGVFAGAAYQPLFTDTGLLGGHTYQYTVSAVSPAGVASSPSAPVDVTTLKDTVPPELLEARYTRIPTRVILYFSEPLDTVSAETPGNYGIDNGITVTDASLDNDAVTLTTSIMNADIIYTVTVTGVKDNATDKNTIMSGASKSFTYIPLSFMDNCVGYWPFDRTLDDFSATGADGAWNGDESFTTGYLKDCIETIGDSSGPYVVLPRNSAQEGMDAFSMSIWAKKAHADTGGYLVLKHTGYTLELTDNDINGYVATTSGTGRFNTATSLVTDTEWHHYCVTYDGSAITLYFDASPIKTLAYTGTVTTPSRDIIVGKYPWGTKRSFKGKIDELRLYGAGLDSAGVAALYNDAPYAAGDADSAAVRVLLDRNAVSSTVAMVTTRDPATGRVLALHLDSLGMDQLTDHIGTLTAMRALYCTGAPATDTALISVDPAIGGCTALETLILAHNTLTSLPDEITALTGLVLLDVGGNMLCNLSGTVEAWLDTYDPDWRDGQTGCTVIDHERPAIGAVVPLRQPLPYGKLYDLNGVPVTDDTPGPGCYLLYEGCPAVPRKVLLIR